jgi:NADH:ubiquinone oxidoreductase subunit E
MIVASIHLSNVRTNVSQPHHFKRSPSQKYQIQYCSQKIVCKIKGIQVVNLGHQVSKPAADVTLVQNETYIHSVSLFQKTVQLDRVPQ